MSNPPEPTEAKAGRQRRIAVSAREEQLILDYRRKTEANRAFNDGLDHAEECIKNFWEGRNSTERDYVTADEIVELIMTIGRARRDV